MISGGALPPGWETEKTDFHRDRHRVSPDRIAPQQPNRFTVIQTAAHLGGGTDFFTGSIDGNTDDGLTRMSVFGEAGIDTMTGGVTADTFDGGSDGDVIHGGPGNDKLVGGAGLDQLFGEAGNDSLDGGGLGLTNDRDILTGGAGRDIFSQYRSGPTGAFNQDLITDRESIDVVYNVGGFQTFTSV